MSNVSPIDPEDLSVHILINALNDNKLKEKILECTHIEGNIPLTAVTSAIKAYEANILISSKKPPENKAKKTADRTRNNSTSDSCAICGQPGHQKR